MIEWVGSLLSPVSLTYIMDGWRETQLILTARKLTHLSPHSARLPFLSVSHSSSLHSVPPADESMMRQRKGKEIREGPLVSRFSRTLTSHAVRSSGMSLPEMKEALAIHSLRSFAHSPFICWVFHLSLSLSLRSLAREE